MDRSPLNEEQRSEGQQTLLTEESPSQAALDTRNCFQRTFGKMEEGSMRGSILALLACAMGVGIFNLPYRISQVGVISYLIFLFLTGLFSYFGMYCMSRVILEFKVGSYSEMSERALGKVFRKVAQFCLIIYPWGNIICYQVLFTKFVLQLLADNFGVALYDGDKGREDEVYTDLGNWVRIGVTLGAVLLNMFFILKKEIGILGKISIVGVVAVIANVAIITVTLFIGFQVTIEGEQPVTYVYHGITQIDWSQLTLFNLNDGKSIITQVQTISSLVFSYVAHQLTFPLIKNLRNPIRRRIDKVLFRVHATQIISYFLVGMAGYLLLAQHIKDRQINSMVMASVQTIPISVGKLLMVFALFFAVPINTFPAREVIYQTFGIIKSTRNHILLSLGLIATSTLTAILFQSINSYFGLLGGTAGVMMSGAIPMICYAKLIGLKTWKEKLMCFLMTIISLLGMVGGFFSVIFPA